MDPVDINPFRYCGEYFDRETGTYYLRVRDYDPGVGRFTTEDRYRGNMSDPLSLNLYTYCRNNPVLCFLRGTNKNLKNSNKSE
ncbi:MAG: RHS repeat-associated core domain-containing protein [Clostridia bacterium]|nr:RHS repeat-associated core domain-containing protein [Clostridia bacterium]